MKRQEQIKISFSEKIHDHQGIIHKITRVYTNDKREKEDLFQEICLQLWKAYPSFKGHSKFTSWMYRVSLNTAISNIRKSKKRIITESLKNQDFPFEAESETGEQRDLLYSTISLLSPVEKAIILLWLEEHTYEEISHIMGIGQKNISVKLVRIRKKLAEMINHKKTR